MQKEYEQIIRTPFVFRQVKPALWKAPLWTAFSWSNTVASWPPGYRFAPPCGARKNVRGRRPLHFFDRCGNCVLPASATGSGRPQFPTSCLPQANCSSVYYPEVAQYILRLGNQKEKQSIGVPAIKQVRQAFLITTNSWHIRCWLMENIVL